jgi:hypothetical protein
VESLVGGQDGIHESSVVAHVFNQLLTHFSRAAECGVLMF